MARQTRKPLICAVCLPLAAGLLLSIGSGLHAQTTGVAERLGDWNRQITESDLGAEDARRILSERANSLYFLIQSDPASALGLALPDGEIARLRSAAGGRPELLETRGEWQGRAIAIVDDDLQRHVSRTRWRIQLEGGPVEVYFAGARPALTCEHEVKVAGVRLGDRLVAENATVTTHAASQSCTTTGVQQTAVLLVSFPDNPLSSAITQASVRDVFFGSGLATLNGYYNENSFGQVSFAGSVLGPFTLDADYDCSQTDAMEAAAIRAADPVVDLTQYSRIVIIFPNIATCGFLYDTGSGTIGCGTVTSPTRGSFTASTSWIYLSAATAFALVEPAAIETGHNLGLDSANSLDFGSTPLGSASSEGTETSHGDPFTLMGSAEYIDEAGNLLLGHFNAQEKLAMGWINNTQNVVTVEASGIYNLSPIEFGSSGLQAIRVQRGTGSSQWLWLEYRQPGSTYDNFSPGFLGLSEVYTGALIHFEDGTALQPLETRLLDFNPVATPNNFKTAALAAGQTWSDPFSNLSIQVESATPQGTNVTVLYSNMATAAPGSLNFTVPSGSATVQTNMLWLTSTGPASPYTITATPAGGWLSVSAVSSNSVPANLMISANPAGLGPGNYIGSLSINVPGANNSPVIVPVTLMVLPPNAAGCWSFDPFYINFTLVPASNAFDPCSDAYGNLFNALNVAGAVDLGMSFSGAGSYFAAPTATPDSI